MFEEDIDQFFVSPTSLPQNGPIYLVKEDNVTSEQTFLVSIQVTDSAPANVQPATIEVDYRLAVTGTTSITRTFLANERRIPFPFTLLPDTLPEGNEAFQASSSPEDSRVRPDGTIEMFPTYLNPIRLASEVFITIEDDDRKFEIPSVLIMCTSSYLNYYF